jgi:hypothetical protein
LHAQIFLINMFAFVGSMAHYMLLARALRNSHACRATARNSHVPYVATRCESQPGGLEPFRGKGKGEFCSKSNQQLGSTHVRL